MANSNLTKAKNAKNDEFYTQYHDIEKEITAYLEFNPNVFHGKTIHCLAMTLNGATLPNFLRKILSDLDLKN